VTSERHGWRKSRGSRPLANNYHFPTGAFWLSSWSQTGNTRFHNYGQLRAGMRVGLRSRFIPETTASPKVDRLRGYRRRSRLCSFDRCAALVAECRRITIYSADTSFPPSLSRDNGLVVRRSCFPFVRAVGPSVARMHGDDGPTGEYLQEVKQKGIPGSP